METLEDSTWDVVISGTGLPQSLLALALSRSDKKILHVDRNSYYGGDEAALSLQEAEDWAKEHAGASTAATPFSHAAIDRPDPYVTDKLSPSRSYALALAPQLLYTRSSLLPALVSSKTHSQLDFQAIGSWFILSRSSENNHTGHSQLVRVPGGREDIFQADSLDLKAKRSLMKFLRFVASYEDEQEKWDAHRQTPLTTFLEREFSLPPAAHPAIVALTMSIRSPLETTVEFSLPRIKRHLHSIGVFGPGFAALLPKYGGLAEIGQVACRAGAVGGGVYVLGKGISDVQPDDDFNLGLRLSDGEKVTTKWLAGTQRELPGSVPAEQASKQVSIYKSITVVSSPLTKLFPTTSEGGVTPAGAVVLMEDDSADDGLPAAAPVHILVHSSESGECPSGQCVLYTSGIDNPVPDYAVESLLMSLDEQPPPQVLWSMKYIQQYSDSFASQQTGPVLTLGELSPEMALEDTTLDDVKFAWQRITDEDAEAFMKFEAREGTMEGEDAELQ